MEEKKFFDFKSNEAFNLDAEYKTLFGDANFIPSNPTDDKLKDAEIIIAELGSKYLEGLSLQKYEDIFLNLNGFLIFFHLHKGCPTPSYIEGIQRRVLLFGLL